MSQHASHSKREPNRRSRWRRPGLLALVATAGLAAGASQCSPEPVLDTPSGAWWSGRRVVVAEVLAQLQELEGTPLARHSARLSAALPDCPRIGAHLPEATRAESFDPQRLAARCLEPGDALDRALRDSGADFAFGLRPSGEDEPVVLGNLQREREGTGIALRWIARDVEGPMTLLLPGAQPAGRGVFSALDRLVHLRVRPRHGVSIASLVPEESQADRLFHLRSSFLENAVLDGSWEGAVYTPREEREVPGVVLALGVRAQRAGVAAAERFIANLQKTWPVHRSDFTLDSAPGACLLDLRILPEFAPCYVVTRGALIVGWNAAALEHALSADARPSLAAGAAPARLEIDLQRIRRADEFLASRIEEDQRPLLFDWPWERVVASGALEGDTLVLQVQLSDPRDGSRS